MFKTGSFGDEIYHSMEKQLVSNQLEDKHGFNKLSKAANYLHAAAEIFEQAGMSEQAEEITEVLQGLAQEFAGKTASSSEKCEKCGYVGEGKHCDVCKEDEEKAKAKKLKSPFTKCDHYQLVRKGGRCPHCHKVFKGNLND